MTCTCDRSAWPKNLVENFQSEFFKSSFAFWNMFAHLTAQLALFHLQQRHYIYFQPSFSLLWLSQQKLFLMDQINRKTLFQFLKEQDLDQLDNKMLSLKINPNSLYNLKPFGLRRFLIQILQLRSGCFWAEQLSEIFFLLSKHLVRFLCLPIFFMIP